MIFDNKRILAFASILFISCLFYTTLVLDFTHTPRFFILSALLVIYILFFVPSAVFARPINLTTGAQIMFCIWSFSSALWATNTHEVWFVASKSVCSTAVFLIAVQLYRTNEIWVNTITKLALFIACISTMYALLQRNEIDWFGIRFEHESPLYYITSTSSHKNLVSSFLYLILPFILIGRFRPDSIISYFRIAVVISILFVLIILQTRGVWIARGASAVVFCIIAYVLNPDIYRWIGEKRSLLIASMAIVMAVIVLYQWEDPVISNTDSIQERMLIWRNTVQIIGDNSLLGVGAGNWQIHFPQYSLSGIWRCDELNVSFQRPHNDFLWIWSELGAVGLFLQLFVWITALYRGIKGLRLQASYVDKLWLALFIAFYCGGAVILFVDFPIERAEHTIFIALGAAYLFTRSSGTWSMQLPYPKLLKYGAIMILCFSTFVALKRVSGEYFTKQLYAAKMQRDGRSMLRNANQAMSFAYTLDPVSVPIAWYCGTAFIYERNIDGALGCFKRASQHHPYHRNVLNDLGSGYMAKNNIPLAERCYKEAIRISPRYDESALNLVALYIQEGKLDLAKKWDSVLTHSSARRDELKLLFNE